ncbi:hypothetical protein Anapl_03322 [Anas platyrhynchos]|uniref:Uncharacterized protein n=1 Tax=Anas platyrhynchos TaxID=8839 RepID=R0LH72_ANAPL|nr:hypothetical protein Anapl_03322 [Anas platyrhynchos]
MTDLQNAKPHVHARTRNSIVQRKRKGSKASIEIKQSHTVRILERNSNSKRIPSVNIWNFITYSSIHVVLYCDLIVHHVQCGSYSFPHAGAATEVTQVQAPGEREPRPPRHGSAAAHEPHNQLKELHLGTANPLELCPHQTGYLAAEVH